MTTDRGIHEQISELVAREHDLRARLQAHEIEPAEEHARLRDLEAQLDQCWDLLRQRQALRDAGDDPDAASVRPVNEVEGYLG
ncbi:MAG: hypothetical protein JWQ32_802 [Marmoricola sp.]|nr:hypothetical protein [Marmoricola sp.]